ncbi:hypothetical protein [Flavobacterium cerinum]|uniref:Uncharacterized protein n=1 Tax=Flavobacterium cerinum TaxID=2502784 RepID=A0ABY5IPD8_9FLAO|nr:hypothetical protein [Flavobacterium cerinum]UUC44700.1 hypothetical protein NOX80_13800 [Flavobacterium cerinum]
MEIKNIDGLKVSQIRAIVNSGGKFVIFPYTVSIVLMTFKRSSSIYLVRPEESSFKYSYKHVLVNGIFGWWGLPWGPVYTIQSLYHQISGGKEVTKEIMTHLAQHDPEANTSTYNINGAVSSNTSHSTGNNDDQPSYNIPR